MKTETELPVIRAWYEFTLWLVPKIQKFPRDLRFVLGEKIERVCLDVLDCLIEAKFQKQRVEVLERVNLLLEKLRFHLRLATDLKAISIKSLGNASQQLIDIGVQVGGWKRAAEQTRQ